MKRVLHLLCCCLAIGALVYLLVQLPEYFRTHNWLNNVIYVLAIAGWGFIVNNIAKKKYKWTRKFFK